MLLSSTLRAWSMKGLAIFSTCSRPMPISPSSRATPNLSWLSMIMKFRCTSAAKLLVLTIPTF